MALGSAGAALSRWEDIPVQERRLGDTPLGILARLLILARAVPRDPAERAFAPLGLERAERLGVIASSAHEVRPRIRIVPHDRLLVASDPRLDPHAGGPSDHVAGVARPSATLAHLTVRRPVGTALDVGTGCGIQALLLAAHAGRVVATDLNSRALRFAAFNARLNGISNIETREGSFLEPVAGERYDLVVSNPPYVISPDSAYLFRDSGMRGDSVSEAMLRGVGAHLAEGGFATVMVSWIAPTDEPLAPLRAWLAGNGCDALILHYNTQDALTAASGWNSDLRRDETDFAAALDRWLAYYREIGAERLGYAAVVLRKRSGAPNWIHSLEFDSGRLGPASAQLLRLFAGHDRVARLAEEGELLADVLRPAPEHRVEQVMRVEDGRLVVTEAAIALSGGLALRAGFDALLAQVVARLDGRRALREVIAEVGRAGGVDAAEVAHLERAVTRPVKRLLELGILELVE